VNRHPLDAPAQRNEKADAPECDYGKKAQFRFVVKKYLRGSACADRKAGTFPVRLLSSH
jgi:hypothetical protein